MSSSLDTKFFVAVLMGLLVTGLVLAGGSLFRIQARSPGIFIASAVFEGLVTGALFFLWRRAKAYSQTLRFHDLQIREHLQMIVFRCGNDQYIVSNVQKILQLLERNPPPKKRKKKMLPKAA